MKLNFLVDESTKCCCETDSFYTFLARAEIPRQATLLATVLLLPVSKWIAKSQPGPDKQIFRVYCQCCSVTIASLATTSKSIPPWISCLVTVLCLPEYLRRRSKSDELLRAWLAHNSFSPSLYNFLAQHILKHTDTVIYNPDQNRLWLPTNT